VFVGVSLFVCVCLCVFVGVCLFVRVCACDEIDICEILQVLTETFCSINLLQLANA